MILSIPLWFLDLYHIQFVTLGVYFYLEITFQYFFHVFTASSTEVEARVKLYLELCICDPIWFILFLCVIQIANSKTD